MRLSIVIRKEVADEAEAVRVTEAVKNALTAIPGLEITAHADLPIDDRR